MLPVTVLSLFFLGLASANPARIQLDNPGKVDSDISWRVVGGQDAPPGAFPFIYSLRSAFIQSHRCGGSFISENYAITAAHCVVGYVPSDFLLVAGTNHIDDTSAPRLKIVEIIVHPSYDPSIIQNDVALLKLAEPLPVSSLIQTIAIEQDFVDGVIPSILIGWGRLSASGLTPNNLQYLKSLTYPISQCQNAWGGIMPVSYSQVCTWTQIGQGACYGDSGGPLVAQVNGVYVLIGLVSWGQPCAVGMPDVYTRVSTFSGWINSII